VCDIRGIIGIRQTPRHNRNFIRVSKHFFISATSLILNDYFDIESDKINAPERPLPAGLVTERDVVLLSIVVTMLGFITGYLISL
jgi:geranylgeranylglycerol-phosphate geranylgeranyltransferase